MAIALIGEVLKVAVLLGLLLAGTIAIQMFMKNRSRKISYLRIFIQLISQFAIFYLISFPLILSVVLAVVLMVTLFAGRFFCGWICPFGFYMDLVTMIRKALKVHYWNLPEKLNLYLHRLRYVLLAVFLVAPLFLLRSITAQTGALVVFLLGPFNSPRILLGPLVPIIAPWKILGFNLNYPYVDQIVYYSSADYVVFNVLAFVVLTVVGAFVVRRFWCRFCPTGASVAEANRFRGFRWAPLLHLEKDEAKCTKCGICKRVCTVQVTDIYERSGGEIKTSICILCLRCVEMCPHEGCLKVKAANKILLKSRNWLEPATIES